MESLPLVIGFPPILDSLISTKEVTYPDQIRIFKLLLDTARQKAAQKKYSELKPELNDELSLESPPLECEVVRSLGKTPEAASGTEKDKDSCEDLLESAANHGSHDGKTQDFWDNRDVKQQNHDGEGGAELQESLSIVDAAVDSKDGTEDSKDAKPGNIQESFAFEVPVRNGEGKAADLPSAHRIDSWLPARVPETDK